MAMRWARKKMQSGEVAGHVAAALGLGWTSSSHSFRRTPNPRGIALQGNRDAVLPQELLRQTQCRHWLLIRGLIKSETDLVTIDLEGETL